MSRCSLSGVVAVVGGFDLGGSVVVELAVEALFVKPADPAADGDLEIIQAPP